MKMLTLNRSETAHATAEMIANNFCEWHRGAFRLTNKDTEETYCVVLFGNDGYNSDAGVEYQARTKAYVHNLYAGFANLLPEGAVEFGTNNNGSSWCIMGHFPKPRVLAVDCLELDFLKADEQVIEEDFIDQDLVDAVAEQCWANVVWQQWESQLSLSGA